MYHQYLRRRRTPLVGLAAALVLSAGVVPLAHAAAPEKSIVTSTASGGMAYAGTSGANSVRVTLNGSVFTIDDSVPIAPGAGCAAVASDVTKATCTAFKLPDGSFKAFSLSGRGGDDTLNNATGSVAMIAHGDAGSDSLFGGPKNDQLFGDADISDQLQGNGGADLLDGGSGKFDAVSYREKSAGVTVSIDDKADDGVPSEADNVRSSVEVVLGSDGDDLISGSQFDNNLLGEKGNDILIGGLGADALLGQEGNDLLFSNGQFSLEQDRDGARDFLSGSLSNPNSENDTCAGSHGEDVYDSSCDVQ